MDKTSTVSKSFTENIQEYFKPLYDYLSIKLKDLSINNSSSRDLFIKCLQKYGVVLIVLFFILFMVYFATTDIFVMSTHLYLYYAIILIPLIFGISYSFSLFRRISDSPVVFLVGAGGIFLLIGLIYLYSKIKFTASIAKFSNIILLLFIFLIALIALAIFYKIFLNYLNRQTGWIGFIIQFLFYLPCLISDFITYEVKTTPNVVFVLFILELLLILGYMYIPTIIQKISINSDNIDLLKNSVFLNESTTIANNEIFRMYDKHHETYTFRKNYAFSMWIYVNTQQPSYLPYSKETTIFDYGKGKPSLVYNTQNEKGKYTIQYSNTNTNTSTFEIDIPNQKWNYLVFNINDNITDFFLNGKLVKSLITDKNNIPTFSESDFASVGDKNGLDGAICNIKYYKTPLTKYEITNSYNLLMYKNPPIQQ